MCFLKLNYWYLNTLNWLNLNHLKNVLPSFLCTSRPAALRERVTTEESRAFTRTWGRTRSHSMRRRWNSSRVHFGNAPTRWDRLRKKPELSQTRGFQNAWSTWGCRMEAGTCIIPRQRYRSVNDQRPRNSPSKNLPYPRKTGTSVTFRATSKTFNASYFYFLLVAVYFIIFTVDNLLII